MRFARFQSPSAFLVSLAMALFLCGIAQAEDEGGEPVARDIVLLASEDVRPALTAALQIELASRGARVIPGEPSSGETLLLRDADAQRMAIASGALAAVRLESDASGLTIHVIVRDGVAARRTPVAREADARTMALIIVSLLDDPAPSVATASARISTAPELVSSETEAAAVTNASPSAVAREPAGALESPALEEQPRDPGGLRFSGRIGTGGFGLVNDRRFIPGAMLRGGVGLEIGYFEGALLADAGLMLDELPGEGGEIQPLARFCVEAGGAFPIDSVLAFHVGGRVCGGIAQLRKEFVEPPFSGSFVNNYLGGLASAGGYLALSFRLSRSARLYVRADVEGALLESSMHVGEVFPVLSAILSMF